MRAGRGLMASMLLTLAMTAHAEGQAAATPDDPVARKVARLLEEMTSPDAGTRRDLIALGGSAVPSLLERLPALGGYDLEIVLDVLAEAPPAAAIGDAVAARLGALLDASPRNWRDDDIAARAIRMLARCRHSSLVPLARRILQARELEGARAATRQALVTDGSSSAVSLLRESMASLLKPPATAWFRPPMAHGIVELVGDIPAMTAREEANEAPIAGDDLSWGNSDVSRARGRESGLLLQADHAAIARAIDGREMLVFPSSAMGGWLDEWVVELRDGRPRGPARLLPLPVPEDWLSFVIKRPYVFGRHRLDARIEGDELILSHGGEPETRQRLSEAWRDTDEDGLTDLVELRLRLDPSERDTDGDGIDDAMDRAPNATRQVSASEDDAIALAIVAQVPRQWEDDDDGGMREPRIVVRDVGLEWTGVEGLTLTFPPGEVGRFLAESGLELEELTIKPMEADVTGTFLDAGELTPDRRARWLEVATGGSSITWVILVRQLSGDWYVERASADIYRCGELQRAPQPQMWRELKK